MQSAKCLILAIFEMDTHNILHVKNYDTKGNTECVVTNEHQDPSLIARQYNANHLHTVERLTTESANISQLKLEIMRVFNLKKTGVHTDCATEAQDVACCSPRSQDKQK